MHFLLATDLDDYIALEFNTTDWTAQSVAIYIRLGDKCHHGL